jgi:hypothetical protein
MSYRLRTLLILLAVLPPIIALTWLALERYRSPQGENSVWEGQLSLIHGAGQTVEPDDEDQSPSPVP